MFTIQVIKGSTGKPVSGKRVRVSFDGWRGLTNEKLSDSNGEVHFTENPGEGTIYIDHKSVFHGKIEGLKHVYI